MVRGTKKCGKSTETGIHRGDALNHASAKKKDRAPRGRVFFCLFFSLTRFFCIKLFPYLIFFSYRRPNPFCLAQRFAKKKKHGTKRRFTHIRKFVPRVPRSTASQRLRKTTLLKLWKFSDLYAFFWHNFTKKIFTQKSTR